jgi:N4-gp56 family major capsid protein
MSTTCINKARAFLSTKGAKPFAGGYIWIAHPNVTYDMREQVGWNAWVEVKKYTDLVKDIVAWEIWTLMWVRIVESSFVQTVSSTVTVYPTYVFGEGAYGTSQLQAYETTFISRNNKDSYNPLGLFSIVGWKMAIASIILQQDALVRIESASTLSYAW